MLNVSNLLDRTSKTVSSVAAISLGLAVIAVSAVVVKENFKELFGKRIKAIVCIKKHSREENNVTPAEGRNSKGQFIKKGNKKTVSKEAGMDVKDPNSDKLNLETVE